MGLRSRVVLERGVYRLEYFARGDWQYAFATYASAEEAIEAARRLDETTTPTRTIPRAAAVVVHDTGGE